jgi:hypothetical protein
MKYLSALLASAIFLCFITSCNEQENSQTIKLIATHDGHYIEAYDKDSPISPESIKILATMDSVHRIAVSINELKYLIAEIEKHQQIIANADTITAIGRIYQTTHEAEMYIISEKYTATLNDVRNMQKSITKPEDLYNNLKDVSISIKLINYLYEARHYYAAVVSWKDGVSSIVTPLGHKMGYSVQ